MSKSSKKRSHDAKMRAKRAFKAQRKATYAALKGTSKKSKKVRTRSRTGRFTNKHQHRITHCGNPGCARCFPQFAKKKLAA